MVLSVVVEWVECLVVVEADSGLWVKSCVSWVMTSPSSSSSSEEDGAPSKLVGVTTAAVDCEFWKDLVVVVVFLLVGLWSSMTIERAFLVASPTVALLLLLLLLCLESILGTSFSLDDAERESCPSETSASMVLIWMV